MIEAVSETIYERIGGEKAVDSILPVFYKKILGDPLVAPFFEGIKIPSLINKQKSFLIFAFGGPSEYTYWQRGLRSAHKSSVEKGMGDLHFDRVLLHLENALKEFSVSEELIAEIVKVVEGTRKHVLNK